jgi:WhiB family redox-sensing transcriptional regulator
LSHRGGTTFALTEVEAEEATHQYVLALMEHGAPGPADLFRVMLARPTWQRYAACRGAGTSMHFPNQGAGIGDARAVCAGCEVRRECLDYAVADPSLQGVWAGTSDRDRRKMRREGWQTA